MRLRASFKEHCVAGYFALAITISWVGVLLVVGQHGIPATPAEADEFGGDAYMPMLVGPVVAGLLFIGLVHGRAGFRDLRSRLGRWRVAGRWWVAATLAVPVIAVGSLLPLRAVSSMLRPEFLATDDNKAAFIALGVVGGLLVGLFEEIGWTGFAIPQLRQRHSVLATGLVVGMVWGFWHLLLFVWDSGDASGAFDLSLLVPAFLFCLLVLPLCRLLMVWVYDHTESVLLAVVMHASITGIVAMIVIPLDASGWPLTWWYLAFAAALSLVAIALNIIPVRRHRPRPSPPSPPTRDAGRPRVTVEAASSPST